MKIHIVKPRDNPWTLANIYKVSSNKIIEANNLNDLNHLIVGQALVIPSSEQLYTVHAGDSLWSIANKFKVSVDSLMKLNNLSSSSIIHPGSILKIPQGSKNYGVIETNGFIFPSTPERENSIINESGRYLTYISPFSYQLNSDGTLKAINDQNILEQSKKYKIAPMMTVTNISGQNFDSTLINNLLSNNALQQTLIKNIELILKTKKYYGVIIDFERIDPQHRTHYNEFLKKLTAELHKQKYIVATALAPKTYDITTGAWHGAHDYKAHGEIVDFVIIMTYEWGWSGGPPMAVAPINEVQKVINYAVSVIPPKKIMLGMPLYGYDWSLPYTPGGEFAKSVGMQEALQLAIKYGAIIKYDQISEAPYFNYYDKNKTSHIVWFEDARSVMAKYRLINKYGLRGASYWTLGKPFPQNWIVLDNMFEIKKL